MHRFFVTDIHDDQVTFSLEQAHQISAVLRMQPGEGVIVLDNTGMEFEAVLTVVDRKRVTAVIRHKRLAANEPKIQLTLYQSVLKRDNFEWVLQKGTEIGVARFVPLLTERTVARLPKKLMRWRRILTEAAEQSGRGRIPELAAPIHLAQAVVEFPSDHIGLIPWEEAKRVTVREGLQGVETAVSLFIGPEGGFSKDEIQQARQRGVVPITLGRRILRAETAAVVIASLVLHELGELA